MRARAGKDVLAACALRLVGGQDPAAKPQTSALLLPHRPRKVKKQSAQPSLHSGAQIRSDFTEMAESALCVLFQVSGTPTHQIETRLIGKNA
ncbi:hypothetical protein TP47_02950 [Xanthomonas citri pv. aurantifolii]|nr:hypothetical protein TP37_00865 [Xanthomonas citri pv. aurantifolii]AMV01175.1 hypothetical protein TP50_00850 [Xanthomonas citri pv. aurantifolii]AMV06263.1 hypothetical protein AC028_04945 [Xanthomonas citri pv. aurantifolii]ARE58380.1 hypothetical protein TP45_19970 [Xanthomonas citri pv. aurantifolii]TBW98029.1 hypothetical protein TP49_08395 [Xanthomonas citri pv. aurantifolii]